jgi:hypothetical protein
LIKLVGIAVQIFLLMEVGRQSFVFKASELDFVSKWLTMEAAVSKAYTEKCMNLVSKY